VRFGYGKGEGTKYGDGFASSREQDSCYVVTGREEIERGEWSCKIDRHFVSDIASLCRV
jgi:hypothetical protein